MIVKHWENEWTENGVTLAATFDLSVDADGKDYTVFQDSFIKLNGKYCLINYFYGGYGEEFAVLYDPVIYNGEETCRIPITKQQFDNLIAWRLNTKIEF